MNLINNKSFDVFLSNLKKIYLDYIFLKNINFTFINLYNLTDFSIV